MIMTTMAEPRNVAARRCVFLILPHKARGEVSIIAVQVKVSVEYAVKSSEFKFREIRVNETCLCGGGGG
jgi:hypothetical protein